MNKELINDDLAYTLAEFYKIMSDHTRMKIIYALTKKELCVGELSEIVNMSQTAVSYQLRILRGARLVKYRREDIGFVFQFYNLVQNLTAVENVELATQICKDSLDPVEVLTKVGLADRIHNFPSQLSGGEQQRVAIARAI